MVKELLMKCTKILSLNRLNTIIIVFHVQDKDLVEISILAKEFNEGIENYLNWFLWIFAI